MNKTYQFYKQVISSQSLRVSEFSHFLDAPATLALYLKK